MWALSPISVISDIGLKSAESYIISDIGINFCPIFDIRYPSTKFVNPDSAVVRC
jgi:hypothetical protein